MRGSRGTRSLLRRRLGALGAALARTAAADRDLTRTSASQDATAGYARADWGHREAAIPSSKARAPAVAAVIAVAAVCCVPPAGADSGTTPPLTPPTATTADAPPPDPYQPPAKASKPKQTRPAVVHVAPVYRAPVRTVTPPAPMVRVRTYRPQQKSRPRPAKPVHKPKAHVVRRHVAPKPKPVRVTFDPFANFVASSSVLSAADATSDRDRYLWLAGFAFALLAVSALSLQLIAARTAAP